MAKPIKFKHFYKKPLTSLFCIFQNQNNMEIQNTLFVVECTRAEILRRAKIARETFAREKYVVESALKKVKSTIMFER